MFFGAAHARVPTNGDATHLSFGQAGGERMSRGCTGKGWVGGKVLLSLRVGTSGSCIGSRESWHSHKLPGPLFDSVLTETSLGWAGRYLSLRASVAHTLLLSSYTEASLRLRSASHVNARVSGRSRVLSQLMSNSVSADGHWFWLLLAIYIYHSVYLFTRI